MELGLLYSGGKDSTLAALLLNDFYDVTLVTAHFGVADDWKHARDTAEATGFDFEAVELDRDVATTAVEQMVENGYPRNGIQQVHLHALETVASMRFDAVADGTRRDDRVPTVSRAQAQSLEDRYEIDYIVPLSGFGRGAVDSLVRANLDVESGPSDEIRKADYEGELRSLLADEHGADAVNDVFPAHEQTYVTGFLTPR
ncbi:alpha hydrolase [Haladaptatus pallidirubidus]|uniref:Alpha hydrolase n=1 Tax=Haladaptatus pallidirubidus TaxID=1008152 RepID=A0AAV3UF27_9EURY|nr:alpha hydrolase [Haladaptatus pallidirubidus]